MPNMKCTGEKCPIPELTKDATACTAHDCKHRTPPMPDIKEKLVELIDDYTDQVSLEDFHKVEFSDNMADHLISNGVTIQQWISVEERLPTVEDEDRNETVLAVHKADGFARCWSRIYIVKYPTRFLCWMRTPEPPTC